MAMVHVLNDEKGQPGVPWIPDLPTRLQQPTLRWVLHDPKASQKAALYAAAGEYLATNTSYTQVCEKHGIFRRSPVQYWVMHGHAADIPAPKSSPKLKTGSKCVVLACLVLKSAAEEHFIHLGGLKILQNVGSHLARHHFCRLNACVGRPDHVTGTL